MIEKVHDQLVTELGHSNRTDTIFVVTAIVFNLVVLGINSGVSAAAADTRNSSTEDLILAVFILMTLVLNGIALAALLLGRRTRARLISGLLAMYDDHDVSKYYDPVLLATGATRYVLFAAIIAVIGLTSIVVPLIIRLA